MQDFSVSEISGVPAVTTRSSSLKAAGGGKEIRNSFKFIKFGEAISALKPASDNWLPIKFKNSKFLA